MKSIYHLFHHILDICFFKYLWLSGLIIENSVESECFSLFCFIGIEDSK